MINDYVITEQDRKDIAAADDWCKRNVGGIDLGNHYTDNDKFDRRSVGKFICCPFCQRDFNPYYVKSLVQKEWEWNWVGCDHKEPQSQCEVKCPTCKEQLYFIQYVGQ